ncbi:cysteine proteinase 5 precursor [Tieghemostelium lacteum]|uniref:Cysteine proteinase 5 n=1 Tax=Tieghemostelium lacteum TaxID=361077 RepID=A0A152A2S2_TIELA|nr:cysteine proteinase 5 precursor [Tieghemostelium lacteum]|eukprot:KYR00553.1 cysteine proteinase 5 precursor [Tieghemostelium lacteum]
MRYIILTVLLLVALSSAKPLFKDHEYRSSFVGWMQKHSRHYANHEFSKKFETFKSNMDYVHEWNSKGSATVLGLNAFADLTNAEYRKLLGIKFDASKLPKPSNAMNLIFNVKAIGDDATVDWREKGAVTQVKNQGQCGGCWSFSTTGATEGAHQIATGNLVSLSEQQLIDCSSSYGNQGCDGGLMSAAFEYIIDNGGIDTEESYPFTGQNGKQCLYKLAQSAATLSSYQNVTSGSEAGLVQALKVNPVSVAIDASHNSFQLYSGGIYYEPECSSTSLDHGVLAVGYGSGSVPSGSSGDESSASEASNTGSYSSGNSYSGMLADSNSGDYYIVKNSWGTSWGVQGYIYMSRNRDNNCGIATMASYPSV